MCAFTFRQEPEPFEEHARGGKYFGRHLRVLAAARRSLVRPPQELHGKGNRTRGKYKDSRKNRF